ncbi:sporulation delaying protein family toxin (plasmid) [Macrococcoides bohemicum]|uniref:sporulation delaying protein family toxin n=1 Tax=Macrococcoides bohemicum TaxID=1903056 RepID=UPI003AFF95D5
MKKVTKAVTACILSTSLIGSVVNQPAVAKNNVISSKSNISNQYTGEELFKGILMGQGKVAKKFPEIWNTEILKDANTKKSKELANKIILEIKKQDSTFFDRYEKAIYSNNPVEIDKVFNEGSELFRIANENLGINLEVDPATGQCVAVAGGLVAVAGAMYVFGAHTAVMYVQVYAEVAYWGKKSVANNEFEKEMFIQDVVNNI